MSSPWHFGSFRPSRFARLGIVLWVLLPLVTSCALLYNGTTQMVPVTATTRAEVFVDGEPRGFTPLDLELRRGRMYVVTLRAGSQERTIIVDSRIQAAMVGLDVAPGVVVGAASVSACRDPYIGFIACPIGLVVTLASTTPLIVDAATGAWYELSPSEITAVFD